MSHGLVSFASTFICVFALGLQSLNVNQGHYWAAAGTSLMIGTSTIVLYKVMPGANAVEIVGFLAGGVTGITSSMWFHRRFKAWWTAMLARRRVRAAIKSRQAEHFNLLRRPNMRFGGIRPYDGSPKPPPPPAQPRTGYPGDTH